MQRIAKDEPYVIDSDAVDVLLRHDWPGNIRELYHTLERAWLVGADHITARLLSAEMAGIAAKKKPASGGFAAMDQAERNSRPTPWRPPAQSRRGSLGMKPQPSATTRQARTGQVTRQIVHVDRSSICSAPCCWDDSGQFADKLHHKTASEYQVWQEGSQPKQIQTDEMMWQKRELGNREE